MFSALCLAALMQLSLVEANSEAIDFLKRFNILAPLEANKRQIADWEYSTDVSSKEAASKKKAATLEFQNFLEEARKNASRFSNRNLKGLTETLQRQLKLLRSSATLKDKRQREELINIEIKMQNIYSSSQVFDAETGKNLSLSPNLTKIMASSQRHDRLKFAWQEWRDAVGPKIRPLFERYVNLSNQGARENGFRDYGEYWRSYYEIDNLPEIVENLWKDLEPFYKELHAYVRAQLRKQYPHGKEKDAIPAHLLGNMWSQSWTNIYPLVEPNKNKPSLDVTKQMIDDNFTVKEMVNITESFFLSLGMEKLPKDFVQRSMIRKPDERDFECHASAWDMYVKTSNGEKDVRIKQCTEVTQEWLVTTHHEMGHIYYFLLYWDQPYLYRDGANPGFHEAIGETISLSLSTPQHLLKIGLLKENTQDEEEDINNLMKVALSSIVFLPFGYLLDQWRWGVFSGKIQPSEYNTEWWKLRTRYQGIKPPVERSDKDFDPGAKFHVSNDVPYIRYFISSVLQFQFHKAACKLAGFDGPLHQCSIYQSKEAGKKISEMLQLGKSRPWPEALEKLTNKRTMDVGPMREYFWPLYLWLRQQRCSRDYPIGWPENPGPEGDPCVVPTTLPDTSTRSIGTMKAYAHAWSLNSAGTLIMTIASLFVCLIVINK